jgi:putative membrane protein
MTNSSQASWAGAPLSRNRLVQGLLGWYLLFWLWMAISPVDRSDWLLENILAVAAVAVLILTARRFQFSNRSYVLITLFLTVHAIGAHYTYAKVPLGFWLQDLLNAGRNPFDRLVHFAYGLLLAYPIREVLVRLAGVSGAWSYVLPVSATLAQSGLFELIEAVAATVVNPELGAAYLGMQGDEWDAQKDMAAALTGAVLMMSATVAASKWGAVRVPAAP